MNDDAGTSAATRPLLLGGYAAKTCPRAVHNDFDRTIDEPPWVVPPALQQRFDAGNAHEQSIVELLLAALPHDSVDLRSHDDHKDEHVTQTMRHLHDGTLLIVGGRLADDVTGARTGKPDLLIRADTGPNGGHGYHPGDIKGHLTLQARSGQSAPVSLPERPCMAESMALSDMGLRSKEDDVLQLAHYWRMLQACKLEAGAAYGAIIGNDLIDGAPVLAWHDLTAPVFTTFSRTHGRAQRTALERYDHEHGFRVKVAQVARQRTGSTTDAEPLVQPIGQSECELCRWAPVCVDTLPAGELSGELRGTLSVREYLALRRAGISDVEALAGRDTADVLTDEYQQDTASIAQRKSRLTKATVRAQLTCAGVVLRPKSGAVIEIPAADVEIDIDVEWSRATRVYLWGALVSAGGVSAYHPFVDVAVDDDAAEFALAQHFLAWLNAQADTAARDDRSMTVFHYSHAERTQTERILGANPDAWQPARTAARPELWVDLLPHVKTAIDSRYGHGLKIVAAEGAGFSWRDDDPGGLQSQAWLAQALTGTDAERATASERLLAYNEDDVRATAAVRQWLRTLV